MTFIIILIIVAVLAFFVVGAYNTLVKSRMQTQEAWSQIDVQLKRRNDLIPNLLETVKGNTTAQPGSFSGFTSRSYASQ